MLPSYNMLKKMAPKPGDNPHEVFDTAVALLTAFGEPLADENFFFFGNLDDTPMSIVAEADAFASGGAGEAMTITKTTVHDLGALTVGVGLAYAFADADTAPLIKLPTLPTTDIAFPKPQLVAETEVDTTVEGADYVFTFQLLEFGLSIQQKTELTLAIDFDTVTNPFGPIAITIPTARVFVENDFWSPMVAYAPEDCESCLADEYMVYGHSFDYGSEDLFNAVASAFADFSDVNGEDDDTAFASAFANVSDGALPWVDDAGPTTNEIAIGNGFAEASSLSARVLNGEFAP
ncbi:MAG: hypothetical protein ACFBSD_09845 [Paracoccaceae bacterium]